MSPDLVRYVNLLQGTDSHYGLSRGNTLPLVARPFGMTHWAPQTAEGGWFFHPNDRKLQGIRATHQPSPWMGDYGHFLVMAEVGEPRNSLSGRASAYRPDKSVFRPDRFEAFLIRYRTHIAFAPTERCAVFEFRFPESQASRVVFENLVGQSHVEIDAANKTVRGWTHGNSGGAPENFACYFVARFDRAFKAFGTLLSSERHASEVALTGVRAGAYAEFETQGDEVVTVRIGTSFIGFEQAAQNLVNEVGASTLDEVSAKGLEAWEQTLGKLLVEGASEEQLKTFYSCLYRTNLFPRNFHEFDASGKPVHYSPYTAKREPGLAVTDNGFWDTFRTVYPLLSITSPELLPGILTGWVNAAKEGGWFPQWASPGYRNCMIGSHIDVVIADAVVKGITDFDVSTAYEAMKKHATEPGDPTGAYGRLGICEYLSKGYVPTGEHDHAASRTIDYAYDDFCIAQVAEALGKHEDAMQFRSRVKNYANVFDTKVGFIRDRNADGSWREPFSEFEWGHAYVEGGPWQHTFGVPHDPEGLIELHGGTETFLAKLDGMMASPPYFEVGSYNAEIHEMTEMAVADFGQYAHSNQPVHHVLFLYAAAGRPDKTRYWVRRVMNELYSSKHFCGDEDNGEMSAWYILGALGLLPLCPGIPEYILGAPLFPKLTLKRADGNELVIEAIGATPDSLDIQSIEVDGVPHPSATICHKLVAKAKHIRFVYGTP